MKYQCKDCDLGFSKPQQLGAHRRQQHPKNKKRGRPRKYAHQENGVSHQSDVLPWRLNYCPNCKCPLAPVVAAMSLINIGGGS